MICERVTDEEKYLNWTEKFIIENKVEIEVISGISEGDLIVSSGSYLLNSVFILRNGANSMGGMKM